MAKLSGESYWKWRTRIEEMKSSESELKNARMTHSMMEKDIENQRLRIGLFQNIIKDRESKIEQAKKDYEEHKSEIEKELGHSLNNCTINEDYEITQLEEEVKS